MGDYVLAWRYSFVIEIVSLCSQEVHRATAWLRVTCKAAKKTDLDTDSCDNTW